MIFIYDKSWDLFDDCCSSDFDLIYLEFAAWLIKFAVAAAYIPDMSAERISHRQLVLTKGHKG